MSSFPTGVSVVTTVDADGRPRGMTCSSLSSVSLDPPVLSVCLSVTSGTLSSLRSHGRFGVNLLGDSASPVARLFADSAQYHFDRVPWRPADDSGVPRLGGDTIAFAACRVADTKLVGDHVVIFGEVLDADCGTGNPLLYGRRQFAGWPGGTQGGPAGPPAGRLDPAVSPLPPTG
ncbi:flavin reductase family protein [Streptomyces anulatus]|uniref:flavin reductase family protein n=1 Tax=Streptomyces anulatus TaxID=1892 RepID=UPI001C6032C8|nr:flavin reductase family protein [Streptomyces anulatus]QYA95672.1 flavin reductase family protein [Streptomyces anulatus]